MKHQTSRTSLFASAMGVFALAATSANATVILADDFTGIGLSGSTATVDGGAWDTENGVSASTNFTFNKTFKSTSFAGVINPNQKASTGSYIGTITLTVGTADIDLTSLDLEYKLLDGNGNAQPFATNKTGFTTVSIVGTGVIGSIPLSGYTAIPGDTNIDIDRSVNVTGTTLLAGQSYTLTIESGGGGDGHFKSIDSLTLNGTISAVSGNDFSDWIAGYDVGGQTGVDDDPDGDGTDNGVENYFGTAPDAFSQGLVAGAVDTGANTFTFTHPLNATPADDLTATYRWSTDLQTFHDDGDPNGAGTTTVTFVQGAPSGGMVTVTATITGTEIPEKLFVDVEVTQNP